MVKGQRGMVADEVFGESALDEAFENKFHGDAGIAEEGFAEHDAGDTFDVGVPVHGGSIARRSVILRRFRFSGPRAC